MGYRPDATDPTERSSRSSLWKPVRRFHISPVLLIFSVVLSAFFSLIGDFVERRVGTSMFGVMGDPNGERQASALFVTLVMLGLTQSHLAGVHMALFPEGTLPRARLRQFYYAEMWMLAGFCLWYFNLIRNPEVEMTFSRLCFATVFSATCAAVFVGFFGSRSGE